MYDVNTEAQNNKEVSNARVEDYNNDIRLGGTLNPEPTMNPSSNYAQPAELDPKSTGGAVGTPSISLGYGMPDMNPNVDLTNSTTSLNTTYDHENRGVKWGQPNVSQDVPEKGRNQYEDHS